MMDIGYCMSLVSPQAWAAGGAGAAVGRAAARAGPGALWAERVFHWLRRYARPAAHTPCGRAGGLHELSYEQPPISKHGSTASWRLLQRWEHACCGAAWLLRVLPSCELGLKRAA